MRQHAHARPLVYADVTLPAGANAPDSVIATLVLADGRTVRRAYAFMGGAAMVNLAYALLAQPSIPWAVLPIALYGIGFAMAMPSIALITLDLFPTRRGMAASLQGFVSGMVNVVTAGVVSPLLWHDTRWLALGMAAMMLAGLGSWHAYLRSASHRARTLPPPLEEA